MPHKVGGPKNLGKRRKLGLEGNAEKGERRIQRRTKGMHRRSIHLQMSAREYRKRGESYLNVDRLGHEKRCTVSREGASV